MIGLCLAVGAVLRAALPATDFTLAWTHSVEKVRWEEDYRVAGRTLVLVAARVRGSGAGMEVPAGATLVDGAWHYRPALAPLPIVRVTASPFAGDYDLCRNGSCAPLSDIVAARGRIEVVDLYACEQ